MKKIFLLLFFIPVICFAQRAPYGQGAKKGIADSTNGSVVNTTLYANGIGLRAGATSLTMPASTFGGTVEMLANTLRLYSGTDTVAISAAGVSANTWAAGTLQFVIKDGVTNQFSVDESGLILFRELGITKSSAWLTNQDSRIYTTSGSSSFPFDNTGNLVIQARSDAARSIVFAYGAPTPSAALTIASDGNVGIGVTDPDQALEVTGSIHNSVLEGGISNVGADANGYLVRRVPDYAGIGVDDNSTATTIPLVESWVKISIFDTNSPESTSDGDHASDHIVIGSTSDYIPTFHGSGASAAANKVFEYSAFELTAATTAITAATQADPVVITASGHGLSNGELIAIKSVAGMTELNDRIFTVAGVSGANFNLQDDAANDIDGTGFTAYSSGGTVQLAVELLVHSHMSYTAAGATDFGAYSGGFPISLTATNLIELYMKGVSDATNFTVENCTLYILRVGN